MIKLKLVFLLFTSSIVLTNVDGLNYTCEPNITDMSNKPINLTEYCQNFDKICVSKCCKHNEVLYTMTINDTEDVTTCANASIFGLNDSNYKIIDIYDKSIEVSIQRKNEMSFLNDFELVYNRMFNNDDDEMKECGEKWDYAAFLLENGLFASDLTEQGVGWVFHDPEYFCVDLIVDNTGKADFTFYVAIEAQVDINETENSVTGHATLISAVFFVLVFVVYCVLPQLRNLSGMLLMAYVASQIIAYVCDSTRRLFAVYIYPETITVITGIYYFGVLSSFCWLNIMSFDIWWTVRGQRLKRAINRRGELVKFGWFTLYGWGAPVAVTVVASVIDYYRDQLPHIIPPRLYLNMSPDDSLTYYLYVPVGTLVMTNFGLFLMTVFNICLIKRQLSKFNESSKNTKKNENRFWLYVKMSVLMGASWMLEVVTMVYRKELYEWLYILLDLYNALIGVVIFIMFVLNRKTLKMLCKRFNIKCSFLERKKCNSNKSTSKSTNGSTHTSGSVSTAESDLEVADMEISFNPNPTTHLKESHF